MLFGLIDNDSDNAPAYLFYIFLVITVLLSLFWIISDINDVLLLSTYSLSSSVYGFIMVGIGGFCVTVLLLLLACTCILALLR